MTMTSFLMNKSNEKDQDFIQDCQEVFAESPRQGADDDLCLEEEVKEPLELSGFEQNMSVIQPYQDRDITQPLDLINELQASPDQALEDPEQQQSSLMLCFEEQGFNSSHEAHEDDLIISKLKESLMSFDQPSQE